MIRNACIGVLLLVAVLAQPAAAAPVLRAQVTVDDDLIRIGDIFDDAGDKADVAIAPAPKMGRQAIYDATWLSNMATARGLDWRPESRFDRVVVERAGHQIEFERVRAAVKQAVNAAVSAKRPGTFVDVDFDSRGYELYAPPAVAPKVQVANVFIDDPAGKFAATVGVAGVDDSTVRVTGHIFEVIRVPVPTQRLGQSDVVAKADLRLIDVRTDQIGRDIVTDEDKIVGMAPRRMLPEGAPIREGDLKEPIVLPKGTLVSMVLATPYMVLTAQGRAVEDGAQGQVIKVMNTQSKTTVDAVVDGPGRVLVMAPGLSAGLPPRGTTADAR
ncbi:MAG: flagellar basal body P-ring formation chaperone FlgA [Alphaproteobacteria bacterium]